jgi:dethiobiotin synthetase
MTAVKRSSFVITGTDTGVGKTVLACLWTRYWREIGVHGAALKPVCSGDRADARLLHAASGGLLALAEINPWHFRAPLAPLAAARFEKRKLRLAQVIAHLRRVQTRFPSILVEGAGGLLSPLGEDFDSRDLIISLKAIPIVVCPNRLGAINQVLLVLTALPRRFSRHARVVLMSPKHADPASRGNLQFLAERLGATRVHVLPWLQFPDRPDRALADPRVCKLLSSLVSPGGVA